MFGVFDNPSEPVERSAEAQARVDAETNRLALYQYDMCPFCRRVRALIEALRLNIEIRDTLREPRHRKDLIEGGGRSTVPCLRIEKEDGKVRWMYESADIAAYLRERFG